MHWNPAKFAFIDGKAGLGISYSPWLRNLVPDINIAYLAGYKRLDTKQVISASLLYSSLEMFRSLMISAIWNVPSIQMNLHSMLPIQGCLPKIFPGESHSGSSIQT
jgi:hypothetical protein